MWPMYRPCSLKAASRFGDGLRLGRRAVSGPELFSTAFSAGPNRASALTITSSDLPIVRSSLLTDIRRGVRTSRLRGLSEASYYGLPGQCEDGAGRISVISVAPLYRRALVW